MKKIVLFIAAVLVVSLSANAQNTTKVSNLQKASPTAILYEDFEGWDGSAWDWIPTGWTDESKSGASPDYMYMGALRCNGTWHTSNATQGQRKCARAYRSLDRTMSQDEWLISPAVTIGETDFVLTFDLNYQPFFMRLNYDASPAYEYTAINTPMGAYVSTNGGTNWEQIWDVKEDAEKYTDTEVWNYYYNYFSTECPTVLWHTISVDLNDYVGEEIKVAIRYQSAESLGSHAYVDNIIIDRKQTGIPTVHPSKVKVDNQADCFVLSYPEGTTSVAVYNVAGQKIAGYALNPAGKHSIPTAGWPKGIYILKFAGITGETVKVIK